MTNVSMSPGACARNEACTGSGRAARGLGGWLGLAAAPTFALMALWTGFFSSAPDMLCMQSAAPMSGMTMMYLLMSAFHVTPWMKLIAGPS